jgi:hypothetical protein
LLPGLANCAINGLLMNRRMCQRPAMAVVLLATTSAPRARAAGDVDITWLAPEGCPSPDAVKAEIDDLLGGAASERARDSLSVRAMVERGERWLVRLETQVGRTSGHRTIEAGSCPGLASATALIVALMIDPQAVEARQGKREAAPPPSPAPLAPAQPPPTRTAFGIVGLAATADLGVLPGPDVGIGVSLGLRRGHWLVELRTASGPREVHSDALADPQGAYGKFRFHAGTLVGCWLALRTTVDIGACVLAEAGAVRGEGYGTDHDRAETAPWFGLGVGAAFILEAAPWLYFPVHADAVAPLWRPNFTVSNVDASLFRAAPLGGRLTAGVELRF